MGIERRKRAAVVYLIAAIALFACLMGLPQSPYSIINTIKRKSGQVSFDLPVSALSAKLAIRQCADLETLYDKNANFNSAKSGLNLFKARLNKELRDRSENFNSLAMSVISEVLPGNFESKPCLVPFKISVDSELSQAINNADLMEVALDNKSIFCSKGKSFVFVSPGFYPLKESLASYASYLKDKNVIVGLNKKLSTLLLKKAKLSKSKAAKTNSLDENIRKLKLAVAYAKYFSKDSDRLSEFFDSICANAAIAATPQSFVPTAISAVPTLGPTAIPTSVIQPARTPSRTPTKIATITSTKVGRISATTILSPGSSNTAGKVYLLQAGTTQLTISWAKIANSSGPSRYLIRALDLTTGSLLFPNNDNYTAESKTLEGLVNGHRYKFWVHAAKSDFSYPDTESYSDPADFYFEIQGAPPFTAIPSTAIPTVIATLPSLPTSQPSENLCASGTASSISQHGITWTFDKKYPCGKFINGDYWVVGPLVVKNVFPLPAGGRNGSMINPKPSTVWSPESTVIAQGIQAYDSGIAYYNASAGVTYPVALAANKSLVSTISLTEADKNSKGKYTTNWGSVSSAHTRLKTAAVLTVLDSVPPAGSFRPPYAGEHKPLYNISQIQNQYANFLQAPSGSALNYSVPMLERSFERPWILHVLDFNGRRAHPIENMPNYHEDIGKLLSEASIVLLTNISTDRLKAGYIQTGIDMYHIATLGISDSSYFEGLVMITGKLLKNSAMMNIARTGSKSQGRTTEKFYYWNQRQSTIKSAVVPAGQTWTGAKVFFRKQGGNSEYEHLDPTEWGKAITGNQEQHEGGLKSEEYRQAHDSIPHMGMILAVRILNLTGYWPNHAPNDYLTRWMTENYSPYYNNMKAIAQVKTDLDGKTWWSQQSVPNYSGSMGSEFMNKIWNSYKNTNVDIKTGQ